MCLTGSSSQMCSAASGQTAKYDFVSSLVVFLGMIQAKGPHLTVLILRNNLILIQLKSSHRNHLKYLWLLIPDIMRQITLQSKALFNRGRRQQLFKVPSLPFDPDVRQSGTGRFFLGPFLMPAPIQV